VGVYESLDPVSTMKPVVQNESATFEDLIRGLEAFDAAAKIKNQIDMIIAKVQRKRRNLSEDALRHFIDLSGGLNPAQMIDKIENIKSNEAKEYILQNQSLFDILEYGGVRSSRTLIIDSHEDELISHTRGYGEGVSPQDYLEEFRAFITQNQNTIAGLNAVCTKPRELTREGLKSLKLELDRGGFTERQLNAAWKETTNADIAADIISFIRRFALSAELLSHDERIKRAMERLHKANDFNKMQLDWLMRIEKALLSETVLDREMFDTGSFQTSGGYGKLNKIFLGKFDDVLHELNEYLYDDGGKVA
jgi:type I restriction enzyme R subunit